MSVMPPWPFGARPVTAAPPGLLQKQEQQAPGQRPAQDAGAVGATREHPQHRGRVTILLPTKNERDGLEKTLSLLPLDVLDVKGYVSDVLVVDGHSTDGTQEVAREHGARVVTQRGRGKGMAIRSVRPHIEGDYVVMLDADGTYPAHDVPTFVEAVAGGYDVVMGSRLAGTIDEGAMKPMNRLGNHLLSMAASALYGHRTTDVCTGMWGFKREALLSLPLNSVRFEIEAEMFSQAVKQGLRVGEIPIQYHRRMGETKLGKLRDGLGIGAKLVRKRVVG